MTAITIKTYRLGELVGTQTFKHEREVTIKIGRLKSNSVVLEDHDVARAHCVIEASADEVRLIELGSVKGTRLNDSYVSRKAMLNDGDVLTLGDHTLVVAFGEPAKAPLMTAAELREFLLAKREREVVEAKKAAEQEAERVKVWATEQLPDMLEVLKQGTRETSMQGSGDECAALVDLAQELGYWAYRDFEDDDYYAVVKLPDTLWKAISRDKPSSPAEAAPPEFEVAP